LKVPADATSIGGYAARRPHPARVGRRMPL